METDKSEFAKADMMCANAGPPQLREIDRIPRLVDECRGSLASLAAQVQVQTLDDMHSVLTL